MSRNPDSSPELARLAQLAYAIAGTKEQLADLCAERDQLLAVLRTKGVGARRAAKVLGVSPQRVSQLYPKT